MGQYTEKMSIKVHIIEATCQLQLQLHKAKPDIILVYSLPTLVHLFLLTIK